MQLAPGGGFAIRLKKNHNCKNYKLMKIIPVILLLVFSCAVCAQELKEK